MPTLIARELARALGSCGTEDEIRGTIAFALLATKEAGYGDELAVLLQELWHSLKEQLASEQDQMRREHLRMAVFVASQMATEAEITP